MGGEERRGEGMRRFENGEEREKRKDGGEHGSEEEEAKKKRKRGKEKPQREGKKEESHGSVDLFCPQEKGSSLIFQIMKYE